VLKNYFYLNYSTFGRVNQYFLFFPENLTWTLLPTMNRARDLNSGKFPYYYFVLTMALQTGLHRYFFWILKYKKRVWRLKRFLKNSLYFFPLSFFLTLVTLHALCQLLLEGRGGYFQYHNIKSTVKFSRVCPLFLFLFVSLVLNLDPKSLDPYLDSTNMDLKHFFFHANPLQLLIPIINKTDYVRICF
jgi:hypothetical protein